MCVCSIWNTQIVWFSFWRNPSFSANTINEGCMIAWITGLCGHEANNDNDLPKVGWFFSYAYVMV
ncbi:hypothetical protein ACRRTK_007844 [Alexandromys fortis]